MEQVYLLALSLNGKLVHINSFIQIYILFGISLVLIIWILFNQARKLLSSISLSIEFFSISNIADQDGGHLTIRAQGFQHFSDLPWFEKFLVLDI